MFGERQATSGTAMLIAGGKDGRGETAGDFSIYYVTAGMTTEPGRTTSLHNICRSLFVLLVDGLLKTMCSY